MRTAIAMTLFLGAAACSGGSTAATETTDVSTTPVSAEAPTTTEATTTTLEATTTSTEPVFEFPDDPALMISTVQVDLADFGPGFVLVEDSSDGKPLCEGVDSLQVALPPIERDELQVEGDHLFFSNVGVYATPVEAEAAFEYLDDAYQRCNGQTRDEDGTEILLSALPFSPPSILGADRLSGLALDQTTPEFSVLVQTRLIAAGRLLIFVGGTDAEVVQQIADTVVSRTRVEVEPVQFTTVGGARIGPGYGSAAYYSYAEGPDELRAVDAASEAALGWLNANSLERVDEVASNSCVATQTLVVGDDVSAVDKALLSVFSDDDLTNYAVEVLGEVYGLSNAIYCPGLAEFLGEVVNALPG